MYSYSAYCGEQELTQWSCYWCNYLDIPSINVQYIFQNASFNTYGYAGVTQDFIVFSFRGTEFLSLKNWIEDLSSEFLVDYPAFQNAQVGFGFYDDYLDIQSQVRSAAQDLRNSNPNLPFLFTGHSLGAAMSILALADIYVTLGNSVGQIYSWNFGDPRVGNTVFANQMDQIIDASFRIVNQADIVPHLPPILIEDFRHIETEVWFPTSNMTDFMICNQGDGEDPNCSDSIPIIELNPIDHLTYMGFDFVDGLLQGCY